MNDDRFIRRPLSTAEHFLSFDATKATISSVYQGAVYEACFPEANMTTGVYRAVTVAANKAVVERERDSLLEQLRIYDFPVDVDPLTGSSLWKKSSKQLFACRNGVLALLYGKGSTLFRAPSSLSSRPPLLVDSEPADDVLCDSVCLSNSGSKAAAAYCSENGHARKRCVFVFKRCADGQFSLQTVAVCRWLSSTSSDDVSLCLSFGGNIDNVLLVGGQSGLAIYSVSDSASALTLSCLEPVAVHRNLAVASIIPSPTSTLAAIVDKNNNVFVIDCANPKQEPVLVDAASPTWPSLVRWNEARTNRLTVVRDNALVDIYVGQQRLEMRRDELEQHATLSCTTGFTPIAFHWTDRGRYCVLVEQSVADGSKFAVQEYSYSMLCNGTTKLVAKARVEVDDYFSSHVDGDTLYVVLQSSETIRCYRLSASTTAEKKVRERAPLQTLLNKHSTIR